jgi:DNA-binding NarL/FixJ family response regulator
LRDNITDEQTPSKPPQPLVKTPAPGRREYSTRERHAEIHALLDGLSMKAIGRRLNLDRPTVRRYVRAARPDHRSSR